jgi:hypothetical protein
MNKTCLIIALVFAFGATTYSQPIQAACSSVSYQQKKKVRVSVTGVGKTQFEAESELRKNVDLIAGDRTIFKILRANSVGSNGNWISTMVIEYEER